MGQVHWTARAFLSASMVFGILSVIAATSQHGIVGLMNDPLRIRLWLSRGKVSLAHSAERGPEAYPSPYDKFPLESSVSAFLVTELPRLLLNIAGFLYLAGFGLFLIFSWREAVPSAVMDYRNIFIFFIVSV